MLWWFWVIFGSEVFMLKKFVLSGLVVVAALFGNACESNSPAEAADSEVTHFSSSDDVVPGCSPSSSVTESPSTSSGQAPQSAESDMSSSSEKTVGGSSSSDGKSSSSSGKVESSSSSSEAISSSSNAITPVYGDPLLDSRDGRSYKTVVIGNQIWMAEDLKYAPDSGNAAVGKHSWCYEDNDEYCEKYGRLYDWTATVDTLDSHCGYNHNCEPFDEPRQGICPEGWHIPSQKEAVELRTILSSANDDDDFGFDVQLSGYRNIKGQTGSFGFGKTIIYWTIDQYTDQYARNFIFSSSMAVAYSWDFKFDARSVRCLKN
jgi:uncharacterized protein (TIGR02145 family)